MEREIQRGRERERGRRKENKIEGVNLDLRER